MISLRDLLHDLRRRLVGRYEIDDPRPTALAAPYTFYLPSLEQLDALAMGDQVKLIFRGDPPGRKWAAERMWVTIKAVSSEGLSGVLDNDPSDMPQLRHGAHVEFQRYNVVDINWAEASRALDFSAQEEKQVWDRCMVDCCVLDGTPVEYLYRETPDLADPEDKFPDSGWRIRGRASEGEDLDERETTYLAMGVVLNSDDSWLHLIESPIGSAFLRNFETGRYEAVE